MSTIMKRLLKSSSILHPNRSHLPIGILNGSIGGRKRKSSMTEFSHVDSNGKAKMVDVSQKDITERIAVASGTVTMARETLKRIMENAVHKGDVLAVAKIAGILAAKKTAELIPLCHPLVITFADIQFAVLSDEIIRVEATVKTFDRTGVEMEALCAVATAALTIYDMCKVMDRSMVISEIQLEKKSGGRSGDYMAP